MTRPLEGLRILDFTHVLAGPFATRLLADMGADVVKVNSRVRAATNNAAGSPYYVIWNRNKRALALDMNDERARDVGRQLAEKADVVIDNFSSGVLDRWGIGYESVSAVNRGVVYVQMSGMGDGGPWSDFVTYAPTIHALAGLTYLTGVDGRQDIGIGFSYNDHMAGLHAAVAILAGVSSRDQSGSGQKIDLAQFEVGVGLLGPSLLDYFCNGVVAGPSGNRLPYDDIVPHGTYPCRSESNEDVLDEKWIAIECSTDEQWQSLRDEIGNPDWANSSDLDTARGRVSRREEIDSAISAWTADQDSVELMYRLQSIGVPAGVVQNSIDLRERDPQLSHSDFVFDMDEDHPVLGRTFADRLPLRFSRTPCDVYERSRLVGEDNQSVLRDWLGMSAQEVQSGEEEGFLT